MGRVRTRQAQTGQARISRTRQVVTDGLMAGVLFALQVSLIHLPNIELVSIMVILYTLTLGRRVLGILAAFTILEGMFHGFGVWWVSYLYVWPALAGFTALLKKLGAPWWGYGILSGFFGLSFGFLCSIPYLAGGLGAMLAWWIAGIPFDVIHGVGNLVIGLVLFLPVKRILDRCSRNHIL